MTDPTPDALAADAAIRRLKAAYCRFVDTKQWDRLADLFTPDARFEGFGSVPDGAGPADFVAGVEAFLGTALSIHHVHTPEIELTGPDAARAIWPMMDYVDLHPDGPPADAEARRGWIGWGYYEEAYVRVAGAWRVSELRLVRQRMDPLAADHPLARYGRHAPRPDWI